MIRATTPKHTFIFDSDPTEYHRILISYAQKGSIVLEKDEDDLEIDQATNKCSGEPEWHVWCRLTQEETKLFDADPSEPVKVQIRVLTDSGDALASEKKTISVQDVLNDEVLV